MKQKKKRQDQLGSLEVVYDMCLSIPQFLFIIDEQRRMVAILIFNISYPVMLSIPLHCSALIELYIVLPLKNSTWFFFFFFFKIFWVMQNVLCNVHIIFKLFHISYFYKPVQLSCILLYGFPFEFWLQRLFFHCWFKAVANILQ